MTLFRDAIYTLASLFLWNEIGTNIAHLMMAKMEDEDLPDKSEYIVSDDGIDIIPSSIFLSDVDANLRLEIVYDYVRDILTL